MKHARRQRKRRRTPQICPECGSRARETYCEVCGYDLVRKAKGDVSLEAMHRRPV